MTYRYGGSPSREDIKFLHLDLCESHVMNHRLEGHQSAEFH